MDIPTKPSCSNCIHRNRKDVGLKCEAFPDGIPQHIWDYLHPNYNYKHYKPCNKFEFEPLTTKYNYLRAIYAGVIYLASWFACFKSEGGSATVMAVFLLVLLWYESEVHTLKKERDRYVDLWRKCRLSLNDVQK